MPWTAVATASFIVFFLGLGALRPRVSPGVDWHETLLNVITGGSLYAARIGLILGIDAALGEDARGAISLSALTHPVAQALITFLILDLTRYWVHYADHRVPILWRFHRTHHSAEHLNASSGLRMHLVDLVQLTLIPVVLFRLIFDISGFRAAVLPGVLLIGAFFDAFEHANLRWDPSAPLNNAWGKLLNNPHFHSWHHTRDGAKKDGNYGQALTIWDRMFGTDVTEPAPPELYGLEDSQAIQHTLIGLQTLRPRTR